MISPNIPTQKIADGIPSENKLNTLPDANPNIKKTVATVADFQNLESKIPRINNNPKAMYKPIIALKTLCSSTEFKSISNNKLGAKP